MSDTPSGLQRKIITAGDLQSVVRTMKAVAASNIGQYEMAVKSLDGYCRGVELGLGLCFRQKMTPGVALPVRDKRKTVEETCAIVFGSGQGLVGQFNDRVAEYAAECLAGTDGKIRLWAVGERVRARLEETGQTPAGIFPVPASVEAITPTVGQILVESGAFQSRNDGNELYLFYNRPSSGAVYTPRRQRLLPLDDNWCRTLAGIPWPTGRRPEILGGGTATLRALIREYLFVSLFRACAESLAGENASRLSAMQRAEKNIDELLENLNRSFHRVRQSGIDEELFDVISGFESLETMKHS
jgi:F-type H+-transporting ATPase subunit gamma